MIAKARGVPEYVECNSPPKHSAFEGPIGLLNFVERLKGISGKPVGFKLCVGRKDEMAAVVAAMLETGVTPDFITVDGGEGGTGAAPPEFSNSVGMPLVEALTLVDDLLVGAGLRDRVKIIASGRVLSGFSLVRNLALGADITAAARAMMFALGCIQALKCNTNKCPTGITTQDETLQLGLDVDDKVSSPLRGRCAVLPMCRPPRPDPRPPPLPLPHQDGARLHVPAQNGGSGARDYGRVRCDQAGRHEPAPHHAPPQRPRRELRRDVPAAQRGRARRRRSQAGPRDRPAARVVGARAGDSGERAADRGVSRRP